MLHTDSRSLERILVTGGPGSGKSETWCSVADWLNKTKSPNKIHLLDTDLSFDRLAEGMPWEDKVNAHDVNNWPDFNTAMDQALKAFTKSDWLVVDMMDKAWEEVVNNYISEVFNKDAADFFMQFKTTGGKGNPLADAFGMNWQVINRRYATFMQKVIRWPGHQILCTPGDKVNKDQDSKEVVDLYGKFGIKPRGQKSLGHQCHTILLTSQKGNKWIYNTAKDRRRENLVNEEVVDFVSSYLIKVGGWKI